MATASQDPADGSLPVFYGQQMQNDTVVKRPSNQSSRDALLRLPIQQPSDARTPTRSQMNAEGGSSPTMPGDALGINSGTPNRAIHGVHSNNTGRSSNANRISNDTVRYLNYPHDGERDIEEPTQIYASPSQHRSRSKYSPVHYGGFAEEYVDEEDEPRPYRRPSRRYTARPPPAHQNYHNRDPWTRGQPRLSHDGATLYDNDYEPDTPSKPRVHYHYGSEEEEMRRNGGYYPSTRGAGRGPPTRPSSDEVLRLPWLMWMNSNAKNHFVAFVGEFVGTTMFLFFAFSGTQVANIGSGASDSKTTTGADTGFSPQVLLYIALVFAFSLMVNVWIFFRISGGLFNPAVTLAMLLTRVLSPVRCSMLLVAQVAGGIFSSFLVSVLFPTSFNVRTTLSADTSLVRGVFIEAVLTAELVFTIFMLAKEKHKATFIAPVGIGLALFIAELVGVYYTGGSLNPARSFGPCVITGVFDQEHWIYWVGPGFGAVLAVVFYKFIKILEYEVANPGQDAEVDESEREKGQV